jgi:prevent-host-death family protein
MVAKTYKSEEARLKLRDILDEVMTGAGDVVIERYNKPTAVVISYTQYQQWQAWKRRRKERHDQIRRAMDAGDVFTHEEVEAELARRGLS